MMGDSYNKKTETAVSYTARESWYGTSTVAHSGNFDSLEEAVSQIAAWGPVSNNGMREIIKMTRTVTVETTEEVVAIP